MNKENKKESVYEENEATIKDNRLEIFRSI